MHLSQAWLVVPGLSTRDMSAVRAELPDLATPGNDALVTDLWDFAEVTRKGVRADRERDLRVLADRIDDRAARYLRGVDTSSADEPREWLVRGAGVRLSTLTCHLLSEMIVHGHDIARAAGRRWPVEPAHAVLVVEGFMLPVIGALDPRAFVEQERGRGVHVAYELRVRGGGRHVVVLDDGTVSVDAPSNRRIDCRLSVDPVGFLLVAWGRRRVWQAVAGGGLVAWGRRLARQAVRERHPHPVGALRLVARPPCSRRKPPMGSRSLGRVCEVVDT